MEDILGYSLADLKARLVSTLQRGQSWDQYLTAELVIDHKVPLCRFNLSDGRQFIRAWALSNLQLLTWEANAAKAAA